MPFTREDTIKPTAMAVLDMSAMAASPLMLLRSLNRSRKNAATITTGTATRSGARFSTAATHSAPNPTCDRPSPIMEYRFSTRLTPSNAEHNDVSVPTSSAFCAK